MPLLKPVFYREYGSGLYDIKSYFIGVFVASFLFTLFYPIVTGYVVLAFLNPVDDSFSNYTLWTFG